MNWEEIERTLLTCDGAGKARKAETLAQLRAHMTELEQDKTRLSWLLHKYSFADGRSDAPALRWGLSNAGRAVIDTARANEKS